MFLYNAGVSALRGDDFSGAIQDFRKSSLEGTDITIAFRSFANIGNAYVRWSSIIPGKQGRLLFLDAMDSYIRALSTQYDGAVQINYFLVLKTTIAFLDKVIFADTPQQSLHGLILACGSGITLQSLSLPTLAGYPQHNEDFIQEWPCIHAHLKELFSYIQETRDTEKDPSDKS
jgi:hypothetical protein